MSYILEGFYFSFASLALFNLAPTSPLLLLSNHTPGRLTLMTSMYAFFHVFPPCS